MPFAEKRAWIMLVVSAATYAVYATVVLRRADGVPLADVPYVSTLLWSAGASIVATIVLNIAVANAVYLCFTLSALLGSIAKIFAYRKGFPW